ncbi:MAG: hypothetical protein KBA07_08370 [Petrotogaceae bacterium]|nr:hypothetical protein [Petrotogaceae bacterium]
MKKLFLSVFVVVLISIAAFSARIHGGISMLFFYPEVGITFNDDQNFYFDVSGYGGKYETVVNSITVPKDELSQIILSQGYYGSVRMEPGFGTDLFSLGFLSTRFEIGPWIEANYYYSTLKNTSEKIVGLGGLNTKLYVDINLSDNFGLGVWAGCYLLSATYSYDFPTKESIFYLTPYLAAPVPAFGVSVSIN